MSSDESCDEADGTRVHIVHGLAWRSAEITRRVIKRDEEHAKLKETIFGAKKGNPGRNRKRVTPAHPSKRPAPAGKPINLYKASWYNALTPLQKRQLKAGASISMANMFYEEGEYIGFNM